MNTVKQSCFVVLLMLWINPAVAGLSNEKQQAVDQIDARKDKYVEISRQIWQWAELAFMETRSSKLLQDTLEEEGFSVTSGMAGMPTAFIAEFGEGKPVIGLLAEYDALPGMSQDICAERKELVAGATGHGCGHNLLGTGCVAAGITIKDWLQRTGKSGTIRVYGCPAEEGGNGKLYLVEKGFFDDVDVAFTWHPANVTGANSFRTIGKYTATFKFHGLSAHASVAPWEGRSAMDGVEVLNHMTNMMREHVRPDTRMAYVIGTESPSYLPDYAEVRYVIRNHDMEYLAEVVDRVQKAAEGAALGTGTKVESEIYKSSVPSLLNTTLSQLAYENLQKLDPITFNQEETEFAQQLSLDHEEGAEGSIIPYRHGTKNFGASDVSFVSLVAPTVWIHSFCWPRGIQPHTWQVVVCSGSSVGEKGMIQAAKAITVTSIDIYNNPFIVKKARQELVQALGTNSRDHSDEFKPPEIDMYRDKVNKQY